MQLRFLVSGIFVVSLAIYHQSTNSQGWQHQCVVLISFVSSGRAMKCERVGAKRRRERRLRSWAKHERMTVAMALAENLHHSRQKVEGGVRAQKTARAAGARPGILEEEVPSLAVPLLAGAAGEGVDSSSLRFLTADALRRKRQKEEEGVRKREEMEQAKKEFQDEEWHVQRQRATQAAQRLMAAQAASSSSSPTRRKKKRKKKKRNFLEVAALIVDNGSVIVDNGSGMSMAGFAVLVLFTLYSLRLSAGLSCQASWTVWTRTKVLIVRSSSLPAVAYAGLALLVFLVLCSFSLSSGPRCSASWPVSTRETVMHLAGFGDTSAVPQQNVPVTPKTLSGHTKTLSGHTKQSPVSPKIFF